MKAYTKSIPFLVIFCLVAPWSARAEDAICSNAKSMIQKLSDKDRSSANSMMGVKPAYQAKVADGFLYGGESGILFEENQIKPWGHGDLLVMRSPSTPEQNQKGEKNPLKIFVQFAEAPYNNTNDKGTKGGIHKIEAAADSGVICPTRDALPNDKKPGYVHHFFPKGEKESPQVGDIYCVRTRNGENYALMKVTNVCEDGLVFDYKSNGKSNVFMADALSPTSQKLGSTSPSQTKSNGAAR